MNSSVEKPSGIGIIIHSVSLPNQEEKSLIWIMDGDRTRWCPELKSSWTNEFYGEAPHNIYLVGLNPNGSFQNLYVPGQAMKTGDGKTFTKVEQARAMLEHAVSKKWIPKCIWSQEDCIQILERLNTLKTPKGKSDQKAIKVLARQIVEQLVDQQVEPFIDMCHRYTQFVEKGDAQGRPWRVTEIVRGKIEKGYTATETAIKEGHEESRATKEYLTTVLNSTGCVEYVSPDSGRRALSATYKLPVNPAQMVEWWNTEGARRHQLTNWFCPLGYYKNLPGIFVQEMEAIKGLCEMKNGRFVSQEEAQRLLDPASLNIMNHVITG